jgi:hypothetical protein
LCEGGTVHAHKDYNTRINTLHAMCVAGTYLDGMLRARYRISSSCHPSRASQCASQCVETDLSATKLNFPRLLRSRLFHYWLYCQSPMSLLTLQAPVILQWLWEDPRAVWELLEAGSCARRTAEPAK